MGRKTPGRTPGTGVVEIACRGGEGVVYRGIFNYRPPCNDKRSDSLD